jgi:uncharacterized protein (DUF983 family)
MKDKLFSVIKGKCPRCHQSDFFEGSFFKGTPKKDCSNCGLHYEREPGFFQGSYYVTYGLGVATIIVFGLGSYFIFPEADLTLYMYIVLGAILLLAPFTYPLSKIIWANMFFHKDKTKY